MGSGGGAGGAARRGAEEEEEEEDEEDEEEEEGEADVAPASWAVEEPAPRTAVSLSWSSSMMNGPG